MENNAVWRCNPGFGGLTLGLSIGIGENSLVALCFGSLIVSLNPIICLCVLIIPATTKIEFFKVALVSVSLHSSRKLNK